MKSEWFEVTRSDFPTWTSYVLVVGGRIASSTMGVYVGWEWVEHRADLERSGCTVKPLPELSP